MKRKNKFWLAAILISTVVFSLGFNSNGKEEINSAHLPASARTIALLQTDKSNQGRIKINQTDSNGLKQGLWITTNNGLRSETYFKAGLRDSVYKSYYKNNTLRCTGEYNKDEPTGTWFFFDTQGFPRLRISEIKPNFIIFRNEMNLTVMPRYRSYYSYFHTKESIQEEGWGFSDDIDNTEIIRDGVWRYYTQKGEVYYENHWSYGVLDE